MRRTISSRAGINRTMRMAACSIAGSMLTCSLSAQMLIPNAGFEQTDPSSVTKTAYWKPESTDFFCVSDSSVPYKGKYSLKLVSSTEGNHFFNEECSFNVQGLRKFKIRCAYKSGSLNGAAQIGARVFDTQGRTITKTIFTLTENGNQQWTIGEGIFITDGVASKIRLFGNLAGKGAVWFDEISVEEIDKPSRGASPQVAAYVGEYFELVYDHSLISDRKVIDELKEKTLYLCGDSVGLDECQAILRSYTTPMLKDGHSFFTTAKEWKEMVEEGKHPRTNKFHQPMPAGRILDGSVAYISIPTFITMEQAMMGKYADTLQKIIAAFDRLNVDGYIVDLSKNGGGNSMPMIVGIGPLIGNGICGYSFSGDGSVKSRVYRDGCAGWDSTMHFCKPKPYRLVHPNKPIAVIYGNETGSSGEVTALAFIGLAKAKSFGQQTAGATTRIDNFEMSDGAYLNLASGIDADRNGKKYYGPIQPDMNTEDADTAIREALKWIEIEVSRR